MSEDHLSYEDLLRIVDLLDDAIHSSEVHLKVGGIEIDLSKDIDAMPAMAMPQAAPAEPAQSGELSGDMATVQQAAAAEAQGSLECPLGAVQVTSPTVGTFYRAPEPGAKPYVEIGSRVSPDTTVCLIEVMKLMNSIAAGAAGVVVRILVDDATLVECGQMLILIDTKA